MTMHGYELDSYQNIVCSPGGNESVESIGSGPDRDSVEHAGGEGYGDDPNPGRLAGDLSSDRATPEAGRGRGASGESYEDEADQAMFRPRHKEKAATTDSWDGGDLSPSGKPIKHR
jgi:hypothetical protein